MILLSGLLGLSSLSNISLHCYIRKHYSAYMKSIEVGNKTLNISTDVLGLGKNKQGAIIDSGTTLAYLPREIYDPLLIEVSDVPTILICSVRTFCLSPPNPFIRYLPITLIWRYTLSKINIHVSDTLISKNSDLWVLLLYFCFFSSGFQQLLNGWSHHNYY